MSKNTVECQSIILTGTLRMILLWIAGEGRHYRFGRSKRTIPYIPLGVLLRRLRMTLLKKPLVALAHRPAGLALRENIFNLGFAACEIAICWYP